MIRLAFIVSVLFLGACTTVPVTKEERILSNWVMPLRNNNRGDLAPFERTRPIILGDILYAADQQGRVIAVHRSKGFLLWEAKVPGAVEGAFAYGRSKIIVGDRQGNLIALNARDGSEAWRFKVQGEWLSPPAVLRNVVVAVTSGGDMYALGEARGEELWHYSRRGDEKMTIWGSGGTGSYGSTEVFQGFSDGTLVALSAAKGNVIWEKRLRTRERFYDVDMTPYVDEERVIAATYDGRLASLDRITGETQWVFPVGSYSGFTVDNGRLYFAGINHQFYSLDVKTGQPVWSSPYEGGVGSAPVILGNSLIFTTSSDPIYVLDAKTGKLQSNISLGAGALSSATGSSEDGWFYSLSNYGNLYAFALQQTLAE